MWIYADMFAKIEGPGNEGQSFRVNNLLWSPWQRHAAPRQPKLYYSIWLQFQGVQTPPKLVYISVRLNFIITMWFNAKDPFSVTLILIIHFIYLK